LSITVGNVIGFVGNEQTRQALFGELPAMAVSLEIWKLNWTLD
jgi:hypothetical protein